PSTLGGKDALALAIDDRGAIAEVHRDPGFLVAPRRNEGQLGRGLAAQEAGQVDPVVGHPRLLAERDHVPPLGLAVLEQELEEAMPDHSVPDHDEVLLRHGPANTSKLGATRDAARSPLGTPGLTSGASDKI